MEEQSEKLNPYVVPAAIVVAGLLIAGAVVYVGGGSGTRSVGDTKNTAGLLASPASAAEAVGLNKGDFEACLSEGRYSERVNGDLEEAYNAGLGGTPTSIIVTSEGQQYSLEGALPADLISQFVDAALTNDDVTLAGLEVDYGVRGVDGAVSPSADVREVDESDHIRGNLDAPVKIIEYSDLECPFCKRFHPEMKSILEQYGSDIVWVYRHLPLEQIHPSARALAEGSECAAELGGNDGFWEYVDYVFES